MQPLLWLCLLLLLHSTNAQEACSTEGNVRLQGLDDSSDPIAGRVEFCLNGVWGTVCGDSDSTPWSEKNGQVVCRDLGYSGVLNSILQNTLPPAARAPEGTPINIRNVSCLGNEGALDNCPSQSDTSACTHDQDVAITCRRGLENGEGGEVGDIRLIGDVRNGYGAVQLRDTMTGFIGICPDDGTFDTTEANIVCRQLGYASGSVMEYSNDFGSFFPTTRAQGFSGCGSEDTSLTSGTCDYDLTTGCSSSNLVGVACVSSGLAEGTIRLFGGDSNSEGRVEILFNGKWGRICDRSWNNVDGAVACEELGFGSDNVSTFGTDNFPGLMNTVQPIWLNELDCVSTSASLEDCPHLEPIGYADCYDSFDSSPFAVLDCAAPECNVQFCEACRDDSNTCAVCEDGFEVGDQAACMRAGGAANTITRAALLGSIVLALSAVCYV